MTLTALWPSPIYRAPNWNLAININTEKRITVPEISRGQLSVSRKKDWNVRMGVCMWHRGFAKPPGIRGFTIFAKHLYSKPATYIHTYAHFSTFSYRYGGCFTRGALQSTSIKGASLWGLCKSSGAKNPWKPPIESGFAKALYIRGFAMALSIGGFQGLY